MVSNWPYPCAKTIKGLAFPEETTKNVYAKKFSHGDINISLTGKAHS